MGLVVARIWNHGSSSKIWYTNNLPPYAGCSQSVFLRLADLPISFFLGGWTWRRLLTLSYKQKKWFLGVWQNIKVHSSRTDLECYSPDNIAIGHLRTMFSKDASVSWVLGANWKLKLTHSKGLSNSSVNRQWHLLNITHGSLPPVSFSARFPSLRFYRYIRS